MTSVRRRLKALFLSKLKPSLFRRKPENLCFCRTPTKVLLEGTYSLIEATSNDVQSDMGYKMAKVLKDGEIIPHNFVSLKRS